ncbi:alternative ribosome rescue aminoacyl-tRNA hydrolase ArfB [Aequorivita marisscotiae]|uniref:Alternative ribosome rescue aminoacyl-tRNA hydrolase ArfB n=1 Tax=Aequorivita marisscotiae TaxID=3040348 RepID=A0ABY8KV01_9FLAO|nr:alternative ribosome rescue aminoacyl-tRNA hydrolase ArfB [Aequorivita sp. Ant34-E75]WGF93255.1 alternative ribosome rescue aminoacyl-tRNA hydrolase ArfB [Aequorivita sp. Ant34-E75]
MNVEILISELNFKGIRSSGPGGQHVNKTASKVVLSFNLENSQALSEGEKARLRNKLATKISSDGTLTLECGETRSQHRNKSIVIERLLALLQQNLKVAKKRKKTKPSKGAIERRLKSKKQHALKKSNRRPPKID